jgi:hypothetical protein
MPWKNFWRARTPPPGLGADYITCTRCGIRQELEPGKTFTTHCAEYETKEEAAQYSTSLHCPTHEALGPSRV